MRLRYVVIVAVGACSAPPPALVDDGRSDDAPDASDDCEEDDDTTASQPSDPAGSCCDGRGQCKQDEEVPADVRSKLSRCSSGGLCVPTSFVPGAPQQSCVAANGLGDGVCMSDCFGAVAERKSLLGRSTCGEGDLCVPCMVASAPTGACTGTTKTASLKLETKCAKTKRAPPPVDAGAPAQDGGPSDDTKKCCGDRGACVPRSLVPAEHQSQLDATECGGDQLCSPLEMMANGFRPPRCKGSTLLGDYDGVCLSTCLELDWLQTAASSQGSCDGEHRCMPCEIGIPGLYTEKTGAPGCE